MNLLNVASMDFHYYRPDIFHSQDGSMFSCIITSLQLVFPISQHIYAHMHVQKNTPSVPENAE